MEVKVQHQQIIGGGSIHQARLLETNQGAFFVKYSSEAMAAEMLDAEVDGLRQLAQNGSLPTPAILLHSHAEAQHFLVLEYIIPQQPNTRSWEHFGQGLARLHRQSNASFGGGKSNFIGRLPQSNNPQDTWPAFYWAERIAPQLRLPQAQQWLSTSDLNAFEAFRKRLPELLPEEKPALIHGDLWSGNFLMGSKDQVYLIDPAVGMANREMDLAMSRLFGGFAPRFYQSYEESWPLVPGFEQRLDIYQLYYLLVHLNLFGASYLGSVQNIIQKY